MEIELGVGMFGDLPFDTQKNEYQKPSKRLKEIIEEVKFADELGMDVFAMGEHHREDYVVSAPEIILSALSSVTKNILLSSGVSVVSSTDPVKLYQDFAMIDLLSDQRVEIMAGRGSFIESFPLFGQNLNDYNALFEEKLNLLLELNQNEIVNWEGEFRAPIIDQTVYPRPGRELPIWIAVGGTPASVKRAATLGVPIIFAIIGGEPAKFLPLINYYKDIYKESGHDVTKMQIGVHSHTYLASNLEEVVQNYYPNYARQMDKIGRERGWNNNYTVEQFVHGCNPDGALFMGAPEVVTNKIINLIEMFGLTRFIAHLDNGAPSHSEIMKTIELLGKEVFPKVRSHFKK